VESPSPGHVVDPAPAYQHPVEDDYDLANKRRVRTLKILFAGILVAR
jgi:hypothetical protein